MKPTPFKRCKALFIALPLLLTYGCGGSGPFGARAPDESEQALASAQRALEEARAARAAAEAANAKADEALAALRGGGGGGGTASAQQALDSARAAQAAADEARRLAVEAQDMAAQLDIKTDRMFEKSMRK